MLIEAGIDLQTTAYKLSSVVPTVISVSFNPSGSKNAIQASVLDLAEAIRSAKVPTLDTEQDKVDAWLESRGQPPASTKQHGAGADVAKDPLRPSFGKNEAPDQISHGLTGHRPPPHPPSCPTPHHTPSRRKRPARRTPATRRLPRTRGRPGRHQEVAPARRTGSRRGCGSRVEQHAGGNRDGRRRQNGGGLRGGSFSGGAQPIRRDRVLAVRSGARGQGPHGNDAPTALPHRAGVSWEPASVRANRRIKL